MEDEPPVPEQHNSLHGAVTACSRTFSVLARVRKMLAQYSHSGVEHDVPSPVRCGVSWTSQ